MKILGFYIKWFFYFLITLEDRNKYMAGLSKGYECTNIKTGLLANTMTYNTLSKPVKNFKSFSEYKLMYYPKYEKINSETKN